ncbi:MAG: hypothetical protein ABI921_08315 [Panacibacter sp.]
MKKRLLWLPVLLIASAIVAYSPVKNAFIKEAPVTKSISFAVYKGNNYSSEVYSNTFAQLHIVVEKVNGKMRTKVWDKTFDAKLLNQYPSVENALSQKVTVANVLDKKEHLEVTCTLTYNSKGSELRMQSGTVVSGNVSNDTVDISI